jgi:3-hydroxybutyryl-CoA dehydrogenase
MAIQPFKTIIVCGAGTMGSGIAQVAATAGFQVIQFDLNQAMLEKSAQNIALSLQKFLDKGKITASEYQQTIQNIQYTSSIADCKGQLVIEAIIEKPSAKIDLFNQLLLINGSDLVLATNTSSISIDAIATSLVAPAQLVGLHFFNPAPLMKLVEIIKGQFTLPAIVDQMVALTKQLQKTPVICKDSPGFIVNRVARPYYLEAMHMVQHGLATMEQVDAVLEATGFKMGPFKLMDLIGLDINYSVSTIVWEDLGKPDRLKSADIQKEKVNEGSLGVKTKKGFYQYQ